MAKSPRAAKTKTKRDPMEELMAPRAGASKAPFPFVLDELADLDFETKPMFGSLAVYVGDRIVFILRERKKGDDDDGVWVATTPEHHASLRKQLPSLRSIEVFGTGETGWQVIPASASSFEDEVLRACALVKKADPRIGKVPKKKKKKKKKKPKKR